MKPFLSKSYYNPFPLHYPQITRIPMEIINNVNRCVRKTKDIHNLRRALLMNSSCLRAHPEIPESEFVILSLKKNNG